MARLKTRKLGFISRHSHALQLLVVAVVVGSVGAYIVTRSHAATTYAQVKVASYNVLGTGAKAAPAFNGKFNQTNAQRSVKVVQVIKDAGYDIVGVQELDAYNVDSTYTMFTYVKNRLPTYTFYPSSNQSDRSSQRAIIYKTNKFTRISQGILKYPWQNAPLMNGAFQKNDGAPWVLLRDNATNKRFYVINVHMIAMNNGNCTYGCNPPGTTGGTDEGGAQKRAHTARLIRDWVADHDNTYPVIVTGDMNSTFATRNIFDDYLRGDRSRLPYCLLTAGSLVDHVSDVYSRRSGQCPRTTKGAIDHIYISSPRIRVYGQPSQRTAAPAPSASDHYPFQSVLRISN